MRRLILPIFCSLLFPLSASLPSTQPTDAFKHFWNVAEAIHKIEQHSFRRIDTGTLIEEGLKAMMNKVDAHSSFFTPSSYKETLDFAAGQFAGVGIVMTGKSVDDDSILVIDVTHAGPADQAGIESGDKIVHIDGVKLKGLTSTEVLLKLKGEQDSKVQIKVIRDKKPLSFTLTRNIINNKDVLSYFFPQQKALYIDLKTFSVKTPTLIADLLKQAYEKESKSIILDLRKNPGGVLNAAIETAALFLPQNSLVTSTRNNKQEVINAYHTKTAPIHPQHIPLFILVDNFTASCSEILAGALQYHARTHNTLHAFVIGTPTFGKASVQGIMPLSNGCALKLTQMLYYFADGSCVQAQGLQPDFTVKPKAVPKAALKWVEDVYGKETSLSNHITREEAMGGKAAEEKMVSAPAEKKAKKDLTPAQIEENYQKALGSDHQIHTCLTLGNLYSFAHRHAPQKVASYKNALGLLKENVVVDEEVVVEEIR